MYPQPVTFPALHIDSASVPREERVRDACSTRYTGEYKTLDEKKGKKNKNEKLGLR